MSDETQDVTDTTLDVVEDSSTDEARKYSAAEVAKLRREAARLRRERNSHADQLQKLSTEQDAAAKKRAEEQGEFQTLYQTEQQTHQAYRATVESRFLKLHLTQAAIAKGVPAEQAKALAYPTGGLTVGDDLTIEGDLDAVLDPFVAPFIKADEAPPQPKQPIVIRERPVNQKPEPKVGINAFISDFEKKLQGVQ